MNINEKIGSVTIRVGKLQLGRQSAVYPHEST